MLVSVTMTNRRDDMIVAALQSVANHVDACLVVSTHGEPYGFDVERATVGDKLRTGSIAPITGAIDTARARNEAIQLAADMGADWVLILDTDERMHWREGFDVRAHLADSPAESYVIRAEEGFYSKDKFMRPGSGDYQANAHEAWVPTHPELRAHWVPGPRFSELPKSKEQLQARDAGVVAQLLIDLEREPKNARTHFYLGESYVSLGDHPKAQHHYEECIRNTHWQEEAAWANLKIAGINHVAGKLDDAVLCCSLALACNPAMAEAAYTCSIIRAEQQRGQDAVAWASYAIANGCYEGLGGEMYRIHFRDPVGLWEGPFEVLRAVFWAQGQVSRAMECTRKWREAYHRRLAEDGGPHVLDTDWRLTQDSPPAAEEPVPDTLRAPIGMECHEPG